MVGYRIPITLGNIEPLAYKPYQPGKMALVCEGGAGNGGFLQPVCWMNSIVLALTLLIS
ncbi:hypothetical protein YPC_4162 [Yersinia pestis biovar Medievalis str. Harbin 35]|nr:hypothetical protein YPC_4162 [Yersinia pestis biovar Medievalis str. Harbin 35]